ncbi:MAG: S9 family peptidase [Pseudomonadota bacterium]
MFLFRQSLVGSLSAVASLVVCNVAVANGLTIETLQSLDRVSGPVASPEGGKVAFVVREPDLEANKGKTDIFVLTIGEDAEPVRLTNAPEADGEPQWAPDSETIYFLSSRSGSSQVWRKQIDGGRARQVTDYPVDLSTFRLTPDGEHLVFAASVYPDCDTLQCTADRLEAAESPTQSGMVFDSLFVRHWDTYKDGRRSLLFSAPIEGRRAKAGQPTPLMGDLIGDVPGVPFGGRDAFVISPDGTTVYFSMRLGGPDEPRSTDFDIYSTPINGGQNPTLLTEGMDGNDGGPALSPDGGFLAFTSMARPGYESDQTDLILLDLSNGESRNLTEGFDRSVGEAAFTPDGQHILVSAGDVGTHPIFTISVATTEVTSLTKGYYASSPVVAGDRIVFVERALNRPTDIFSIPLGGGEKTRLTQFNDAILNNVEMGAYEQFSFEGAEGDTVYGYLMKPAGYKEGETYPVAFIIHGGPQGSYSESWSYRWNPQVYAGAGYGVVFIDFHGSTGYGQSFTDSINGDWGGKPLVDLQLGLAASLDENEWLDGENVCALGASYGGYMINWIAGNWPDRFNCLVNHDGLFDLRSFYYSTEELWFPEWDFSGAYFQNPELYEKWNPVHHVEKWQTPMMVIQGLKDYRVPPEQSFAAFTALQRQGIESQLLIFPDENHWVLKPQNSIQWHNEVLDWLDRHIGDGAE